MEKQIVKDYKMASNRCLQALLHHSATASVDAWLRLEAFLKSIPARLSELQGLKVRNSGELAMASEAIIQPFSMHDRSAI